MESQVKSRFQPGEIVSHNRYRYRGVIADVDPICTATDEWYYSNQTQPERSQPWYHILVDRTQRTTYVAESNLEVEINRAPIEHPLLFLFFAEYQDGRYLIPFDA